MLNNVLRCSLGLFFLLQVAVSNAGNTPDPAPLLTPANANGTIMADYTSVHVPSQDKTYYECMVWDTETGESRLYYYDYSSKTFKVYEDNVQLPANPLGGSTSGDIMMDYTSVHVPSQDKTYYECMVWDTKTGESRLYYYDYSSKGFKVYEDNVQLPSNPLSGSSGEIMMDYTSVHVPSQDKTYYECMVWDTKSGTSSLYYYDYSSKGFKAYEDNVQLPAKPLTGANGDIMMDYTSVHVPSQDKTYYECMVWDIETGASRLYYYDYSSKAFKVYEDNVQLPSNPLTGANGDIMMDYTSVHVPSQDKTYYECMVWDTQSGTSRLYYYDYSSKGFKVYEDNVQLPSNPLSGASGATMMDYTSVHVPSQDKTYYECMVWDTKSGTSSLYYYDYSSKGFKEYEDNVQLPSDPLR